MAAGSCVSFRPSSSAGLPAAPWPDGSVWAFAPPEKPVAAAIITATMTAAWPSGRRRGPGRTVRATSHDPSNVFAPQGKIPAILVAVVSSNTYVSISPRKVLQRAASRRRSGERRRARPASAPSFRICRAVVARRAQPLRPDSASPRYTRKFAGDFMTPFQIRNVFGRNDPALSRWSEQPRLPAAATGRTCGCRTGRTNRKRASASTSINSPRKPASSLVRPEHSGLLEGPA